MIVFVSGGKGKEDAPSQGGCGGNGKTPTIIYYDATYCGEEKMTPNQKRVVAKSATTDEEKNE